MESRITLGIDIGAQGAFAWVTADGHLIAVSDMPMIEVVVNGKKRRRVSATGVAALMAMRPVAKVVAEAVVAMPRRTADGSEIKMGAASSNSFARGAGIIEGIAAALSLRYEEAHPAAWKRRAGVPKDKGGARQMAQRTWPGAASKFARVKDDGRAEACLLARWAAATP